MEKVKCVVVGDGTVGKTSLLISYTTDSDHSKEFIPTVFDNYSANVIMDGKPIHLALWDVACQPDYARLRPLSYDQTDVFLLCFAIDDLNSYENIKNQWLPEIQLHAPGVPYLLVGLNLHLRNDPDTLKELHEKQMTLISKEQGESLCAEIHEVCRMLDSDSGRCERIVR